MNGSKSDDYITKPFDIADLIARAGALYGISDL
jgi:DNA-binding response OmpR family regulator